MENNPLTEKKEIPKVETRFDDLSGAISLKFRDNTNFEIFASSLAKIDISRYKPISLRLYWEVNPVLTIFALDLQNFETHKQETGRLLVRKYKVDVDINELMSFLKQMDVTMVTENYKVEDFEVIL